MVFNNALCVFACIFYRYVSKDIFDLKTGEVVLSKPEGHVVLKGKVITCNYREMGLQMAGGWLLFRQLILGGKHRPVYSHYQSLEWYTFEKVP